MMPSSSFASTVLKFMEVDQSQFEMQGVKHNALDDCRHDIRMIQEAYCRRHDIYENEALRGEISCLKTLLEKQPEMIVD